MRTALKKLRTLLAASLNTIRLAFMPLLLKNIRQAQVVIDDDRDKSTRKRVQEFFAGIT
jgi:hypothetical protein